MASGVQGLGTRTGRPALIPPERRDLGAWQIFGCLGRPGKASQRPKQSALRRVSIQSGETMLRQSVHDHSRTSSRAFNIAVIRLNVVATRGLEITCLMCVSRDRRAVRQTLSTVWTRGASLASGLEGAGRCFSAHPLEIRFALLTEGLARVKGSVNRGDEGHDQVSRENVRGHLRPNRNRFPAPRPSRRVCLRGLELQAEAKILRRGLVSGDRRSSTMGCTEWLEGTISKFASEILPRVCAVDSTAQARSCHVRSWSELKKDVKRSGLHICHL